MDVRTATTVESETHIYPRLPITFAELVIAGGALIASALGVAIVLASGTLRSPEAFALTGTWMTCAMVFVGILWRRARPGSRMGTVIIIAGFLCALQMLQGSSDPFLYTIGLAADPLVLVALVFVYMSYPRARLDTGGWVVMLMASGLAATVFLTSILSSAMASPQGPLAMCTSACPANLLAFADTVPAPRGLTFAIDVGRAIFAVSTIVTLTIRWQRASRPRRRALGPVFFLVVLTMVAFGLFGLARATLGSVPVTAGLGALMTIAREALPLALLGGLIAAARFAVAALEDIVGHLRPVGGPATLGSAVALALDDPRLRLFYQDADRWADDVGRTVELAPPVNGRAQLKIDGPAGTAAVVDHDEELDGDPELLRAAAQVVLHDREHVVLAARLADSLEALNALQRRLAVAGLAERRRLERDIHDGAQQRLLALRIELNLLSGHTSDPATAAKLAELGLETDETIAELRRIARGVYPPLLTDGGLVEAVRSTVRRTPNATMDVTTVGRHSPDLEAAVYFCTVEALQNAVRHAGPEASIIVRITDDDAALTFMVSDDGRGFDTSAIRQGIGLANLADRLTLVGGALEISSAPGQGTTVRGWVPTVGSSGLGDADR